MQTEYAVSERIKMLEATLERLNIELDQSLKRGDIRSIRISEEIDKLEQRLEVLLWVLS